MKIFALITRMFGRRKAGIRKLQVMPGHPVFEPNEPCYFEHSTMGVIPGLIHTTPGGQLLLYVGFARNGWVFANPDGSVEWITIKRWFK